MNANAFIQAYDASRNGCNNFVRHPLVRSFAYSDGVQECAEAGCHWLLDILATELPAQFVKHREDSNTCLVTAKVSKGKATLTAEFVDGVVGWKKRVDTTDLPEGEWSFYVADEGEMAPRYRMILLTEY